MKRLRRTFADLSLNAKVTVRPDFAISVTPTTLTGGASYDWLQRRTLPVTVTIGGLPVPASDVTYAGEAPGAIAGLLQVNARIPAGLPTSPPIRRLPPCSESCSRPALGYRA